MFRNYQNYEVFENGQIWSYFRNKFLKPGIDTSGYQIVKLTDNEGKKKTYKVHRVVYEAVTGEPIPENLEVNHRSEVKTENFFDNLELLTHKENVNFGTRTERAAKARINGKRSKTVGAFKNGELVFSFLSTAEAGRQGFDQGAVAACCRGERKTHRGFVWRYI